MIHPRQLAPLFLALALALASTPLRAQPEQVQPPAASAGRPADNTAAPQAPPAESEAAKKSPAPATGKASPFDYRSSEQISEDVPVSFPVDI